MPIFCLPNGLQVHAQNEIDATSLYQEIFVLNGYLRHGIAVSDNDCVFDVGANTGLFSIYLSQTCHNLRLYAFEPIPPTFSFLEKNAALHMTASRVKLFNFGLSDRRGRVHFEYDPYFSPTATMYSSEIDTCIRKGTGMRDWARAAALDLPKVSKLSEKRSAQLLRCLDKRVIGTVAAAGVFGLLLASVLRKRIFSRRVECELSTVSAVMREQGIESIDLLKVDVEGSELDIIRGIATEDWPRIRQCVIEVHDINNRVQAIKDILDSHGYTTVVEQLDFELLKILKNYTIYAARNPSRPG